MKAIAFNPFSSSLRDPIGDRLRRAVGRELASLYTDVLSEAMPSELQALIQTLEDRYRSRPCAQPRHLEQGAPR